MDPIRWGVLAPGRIAHSFARDLALVPDGELVATGSRALERAQAFADEYGGAAYGSYEELVADEGVDALYIASPHSHHVEHTMLALDAGRPVLCEKPLTLDAASSELLFEAARERNVFLMEAMWAATHPLIRKVRALLAAGDHGTPRQVRAEIGFPVRVEATDRLMDPALGASALLDMGVYPLTFAQLMLGEPESLTAVANLADSGIDLDVAIAGRYAGGATALLGASMTAQVSKTATVATDTGCFYFDRDFYSPPRVRWVATPMEGWESGEPVEEDVQPDEPVIGRGYGNEILEVHRCLRAGATTSSVVPPEQTLSVMRQMDSIRDQVGVRLP